MRVCVWRRLCLLLSLFFFLLIGERTSAAEADLCKALYKSKSYLRAAACFRGLRTKLQVLPSKKPLTISQIVRYGRNEALCLRRAAKQQKDPVKASYFRERALHVLRLLLKQKLYRDDQERRLLAHTATKIRELVGYVQVTVTTGAPDAKMRLSGGYRFAPREHKGASWQINLRIGLYTMLLTYPGQAPQAKELRVRSGRSSMILNVRPQPQVVRRNPVRPRVVKVPKRPTPKPPKGAPVAGWVLLVGGGALAVAGGVVMALGVNAQSTNNAAAESARQQILSGQGSGISAKTFTQAHEAASTQIIVSGVVGGVGLGVLVAGVVVLATGS